MKKVSVITAAVMAAILIFSAGVFAASDIKLFVNGKQADVPVELIDGSSYVPLRWVSEALGAEVKWDGDTRTITITGGTQVAEPPKGDVKSFNVNVVVNSGPMKMTISKVALDPAFKPSAFQEPYKAVILDVAVENTSDDKVSWYPDQGTIATNTKEQIEAATFDSDDIGGDYIGKVIKKGRIVFPVKNSNLDDITSFNYVINGARNSDSFARIGNDQTVDIVLK